MNKEEAIRCFNISTNCYNNKEYNKAMKFVLKSIKLNESIEALKLKQKIQDKLNVDTNNKKEKESIGDKSTKKQHNFTNSNNLNNKSNDNSKNSKEIKNILSFKHDYYKVLDLDKSASKEDVKKAYKKLALKFHPDKNKDSNAPEAFKAISMAFSVLNDDKKRKEYDMFGNSTNSQFSSNSRNPFNNNSGFHFHNGSNRFGQEYEIDPEELFNAFFGMGNNSGLFNRGGIFMNNNNNGYYYSRQRNNNNEEEHEEKNIMTQLIPVVIVLLLSVLFNLMNSSFSENNTNNINNYNIKEPKFNMEQTIYYNTMKKTKNKNVEYYVNRKEYEKYNSGIDEIVKKNKINKNQVKNRYENLIESKIISELIKRCENEKINKMNTMHKYRDSVFNLFNKNEEKYKEAKNMELPNCNRLSKYL